MIRRIRRLLVVASVAVCVATLGYADAATRNFLWKASSKQGVVYLVGSVHMLTKDYYPLSPALDAAFKDSDLLVEEADLAEMLSPGAQLQMLTRGMLPSSQSLDKVVSASTFALLTKRIGGLGMPIEALLRFKPWMLAMTLEALEWQKAGFDPELGLDKHFYDRAQTDGKAVQGLETLDYQVDAGLNGKAKAVYPQRENGHPVFEFDVELPRGVPQTLTLSLKEPAGIGEPWLIKQPLVRPLQMSILDQKCP